MLRLNTLDGSDKEMKMRFQKFAPLFAVAALMMALAIGCAPAQNSEEPAATSEQDGSTMGHDDSMSMPDSAMADSSMQMGGGEGDNSGH